jgi:SAM-dependent methyltransferase
MTQPGGPPGDTRHALVGPAEVWEKQREFQIGFLLSHGLQPSHYLLDIGCGTLRGGIPLIRFLEVGRYYGIDVRADVLEEARQELRENNLEEKQPDIRHTPSLSEVTFALSFDFIWAFAVLIHMTDDVADDCLALVARSLAAGGRFYANVNINVVREKGRWFGFPVVARPLGFYGQLAGKHKLEIRDLGSMREIRRGIDGGGVETSHMLEFRRAAQS